MPPIHIRFGGYQPPASVHHRAAVILGNALAARLQDGVQFDLQGNILESGHQAAELLHMVEGGAMTMCYFSASYLAARMAEFALLDLPFMMTDRHKVYVILDGGLGEVLAAKLQATTGFRLLQYWDNGFRHLTNALRPIRRPQDCVGLRLRTLSSDVHRQVFALLGFEPVVLDVKDLVAGVRSGAIEAQENPLTNTYNFGIHRYHRYITLSGHFFGATLLLCHRPSYAAWPFEVRQVVEEAASEATAAQRRFAAAEDGEVLAKLTLEQNSIIRLTDADRALFVEAVAPVLETQRRAFGNQLFGYLES